jgi:hypothetical protein
VWVATIVWFRHGPGYGGFDMTTASAFDLKWLWGAILFGVGTGFTTASWAAGIAAMLAGIAATLPVKPLLSKWPTRQDSDEEEAHGHSKGIAELAVAEKRLRREKGDC